MTNENDALISLSKREYFAAMAMQEIIAHGDSMPNRVILSGACEGMKGLQVDAHTAVEYADALIGALNENIG